MKALTELQKRTLEKLVKTSAVSDFYLAGGTALLVRYGHRFSEDFVFFCFPEKIFNSFSISRKIDKLGSSVRRQYQSKDTLIFFVCEGERCVKFSFFEYKYPLIENPEWDSGLRIFIAHDIDILCMKLVAVAQRGSKKDFFDVWFLMRKYNLNLEDIRKLLVRKYENLNFSIILKSLIYFEDAESEIYEDIEPLSCGWYQVFVYIMGQPRRFANRLRRGSGLTATGNPTERSVSKS